MRHKKVKFEGVYAGPDVMRNRAINPTPQQMPPADLCMPTYAGPDVMAGQDPVRGIAVGTPYPQNYQTADEEPIDVYAGPPIDDDE